MMNKRDRNALRTGDQVRVSGSREWWTVVQILELGLHVRGMWHAWPRWSQVVGRRTRAET
jgi:hypothetical protein